MVNVGDVLWQPSQEWIEASNLYKYQQWLKATRNLEFSTPQALRRWSLDHLDDFWQSIWDYYNIEASTPPTAVLGKRTMPGSGWCHRDTAVTGSDSSATRGPSPSRSRLHAPAAPVAQPACQRLARVTARRSTRLRSAAPTGVACTPRCSSSRVWIVDPTRAKTVYSNSRTTSGAS